MSNKLKKPSWPPPLPLDGKLVPLGLVALTVVDMAAELLPEK